MMNQKEIEVLISIRKNCVVLEEGNVKSFARFPDELCPLVLLDLSLIH